MRVFCLLIKYLMSHLVLMTRAAARVPFPEDRGKPSLCAFDGKDYAYAVFMF
jgi:hypothetical protein